MVFGLSFMVPSILVCVVVLAYMSVCIFTDSKFQTNVTIFLIFIFGTAISCVFVGGAVYIIKDFLRDTESKNLQFEEHYLLLLLVSSIFFAAILHPRDSLMVFLGLFYVFIIPTMHILLPVYSISNIVDQSWGTRDGNKASIPKLVCLPKIHKCRRKKKKKKQDKYSANLNSPPLSLGLFDECEDEDEYKFWEHLRDCTVGTKVRTGLSKSKMAKILQRFRLKCVFGFLMCNSIWMIILGYVFTNIATEKSKLNLFGIVNTSLFGISLIVQLTGLTVHRTQDTIERFIRKSNRHSKRPEWIITKDDKLDAVSNRSEK
uniref:Uncharacterized protein n=2 Tax=Octopus bimaculoides TaxID=37653 RepID=A0A0L8FVL7_OCTBM|eukprot:XP_014786552.1 PREDICTED: uncharacterized protein LOC106880903 [Octopus bimaculoides]